MNTTVHNALWQQFVDASIADGDPPPAVPEQGAWYVRTMLGIAGWIGALFLLGFVGVAMAFVFREESAAVVIGLICCVSAYGIFRAMEHNDFFSQFGLAVSFAGQILFIFGLNKWFRADAVGFALFIAAFEALLAIALAHAVHRAWATLAAAAALAYALARLGVFGMATAVVAAGLAVVWLHEPLWVERGDVWRPIGYGLALSLVNVDAMPLFGHGMSWLGQRGVAPVLPLWIGPGLTGAVWVYVAYQLLERNRVPVTSRSGTATLIAVAAVTLIARDAPGITAALLVMTLGYAVGGRVLLGIGVIALLAWLSHYYYSLQMTLLEKSGALAATGTALIALWFGIRLLLSRPSTQEAGNA